MAPAPLPPTPVLLSGQVGLQLARAGCLHFHLVLRNIGTEAWHKDARQGQQVAHILLTHPLWHSPNSRQAHCTGRSLWLTTVLPSALTLGATQPRPPPHTQKALGIPQRVGCSHQRSTVARSSRLALRPCGTGSAMIDPIIALRQRYKVALAVRSAQCWACLRARSGMSCAASVQQSALQQQCSCSPLRSVQVSRRNGATGCQKASAWSQRCVWGAGTHAGVRPRCSSGQWRLSTPSPQGQGRARRQTRRGWARREGTCMQRQYTPSGVSYRILSCAVPPAGVWFQRARQFDRNSAAERRAAPSLLRAAAGSAGGSMGGGRVGSAASQSNNMVRHIWCLADHVCDSSQEGSRAAFGECIGLIMQCSSGTGRRISCSYLHCLPEVHSWLVLPAPVLSN